VDEQEARRLAVVMADVEHFEAVNDRHGHTVGDAEVRAMATPALRRAGRPSPLSYARGDRKSSR